MLPCRALDRLAWGRGALKVEAVPKWSVILRRRVRFHWERGEVFYLADMRDSDPLGAARKRGEDYKVQLIDAADGWVSAAGVAAATGTTPTHVRIMIEDGRLLALGDSVPACFVAGDRIVPGLAEVLAAMQVEGFWSRLSFLLAPDQDLGGLRPLEVLKAGNLGSVLRAAARFGCQ